MPVLLAALPTWARLMEGGGVTTAHRWSFEDSATRHIFWRLLGADVDEGSDDGVTPPVTTAEDFFIPVFEITGGRVTILATSALSLFGGGRRIGARLL